MSQRYYITLKMMHLQGSRYIKPTFFVTAIYTVHYKRSVHQQNPEKAVGRSYFMELLNCFGKRPSQKSTKFCRTVLIYGIFPLFCTASIMKMAQKMMDGFIRDTICQ